MNIEILLKYLNTNCSDKEFEELANWVKQNGQNKEGRSWSCDQWKMFDPELKMKDEKKYSALLDKIHHDINLISGEIENTKLINIINIFVSNNGTKKNSF